MEICNCTSQLFRLPADYVFLCKPQLRQIYMEKRQVSTCHHIGVIVLPLYIYNNNPEGSYKHEIILCHVDLKRSVTKM